MITTATRQLQDAAEDLVEALLTALPFVEDAETDDGYKPGVAKAAAKRIRAALDKAGIK